MFLFCSLLGRENPDRQAVDVAEVRSIVPFTFSETPDISLEGKRRPPARSRQRKGRDLADLRRRISLIERRRSGETTCAVNPNGLLIGLWDSLCNALGEKGLAPSRPGMHELVADSHGSRPAVRDFGLALVAAFLHGQRQAGAAPMVVWCRRSQSDAEFGRLYGPGLLDLGLSPVQLIAVAGRRDADCLWTMEQALRSEGVAAVIGMVDSVDMIASRRLSLAASDHRTWCLLLPHHYGRTPSAASTRWRVSAETSTPDHLDTKGRGRPCWRLDLERSRKGRTGHWLVEWDHATYRFHLAAAMADRSAAMRSGDNTTVLDFDRAG